jgi:hypothetical protein
MLCSDFQERLDDLLDARVSPMADRQLTNHATACPYCREALRVTVSVIDALPAVQRAGNGLSTRRIAACAAVAATFIIGLGSWLQSLPEPAPAEPGWVVSAETRELDASVESEVRLVTTRIDHEATKVDLTYFVPEPLMSLSLLSRADWAGTMAEVSMPFGAQVPAFDAPWLEVMAIEMTPVQKSMNSTWNFIRRSLATGPKELVNG